MTSLLFRLFPFVSEPLTACRRPVRMWFMVCSACSSLRGGASQGGINKRMGIFDKLRGRRYQDRFHEAMLAAEREAEPLRRWLVQEVDALDPEDAAWQSRLANALVEKVRSQRVSLEAMQVLRGSTGPGLVLSNTDARDIRASGVVAAAFEQLKGPNRPTWWTSPEERARRGF